MRVGAAYFLEPSEPAQRRYEAMRAYFVDGLTAGEVATRFGYSPASVRDHSCPGGQAVRSQGRQRALRSRPSPSGRRARAQERRRAAPNRQSATEVTPRRVGWKRELRSAERYAQSALAPATRRAYESDWLLFAGSCAGRGLRAVPAGPAPPRAYESDWLLFAGWCAERGVPAIPAALAAVAAFLAAEADRGFRPV